jgi:hypothetical protein
MGIHKLEPDIYIGFSPALHLQRRGIPTTTLKCDLLYYSGSMEPKVL